MVRSHAGLRTFNTGHTGRRKGLFRLLDLEVPVPRSVGVADLANGDVAGLLMSRRINAEVIVFQCLSRTHFQ